MSEQPLDRRTGDAVEQAGKLGERTRLNAEATQAARFRSRQARTVAQMLRYLRREKQGA